METAKQLFVRAMREIASKIEADQIELEDHVIMREKVETLLGPRETGVSVIVIRYRNKDGVAP